MYVYTLRPHKVTIIEFYRTVIQYLMIVNRKNSIVPTAYVYLCAFLLYFFSTFRAHQVPDSAWSRVGRHCNRGRGEGHKVQGKGGS